MSEGSDCPNRGQTPQSLPFKAWFGLCLCSPRLVQNPNCKQDLSCPISMQSTRGNSGSVLGLAHLRILPAPKAAGTGSTPCPYQHHWYSTRLSPQNWPPESSGVLHCAASPQKRDRTRWVWYSPALLHSLFLLYSPTFLSFIPTSILIKKFILD